MYPDFANHVYRHPGASEPGMAMPIRTGYPLALLDGLGPAGVMVNNHTKKKTYMKMIELQAGLGFGISKFRNVFVFKTISTMESFINSGWQFAGQATAGAKTADSGGAMQGAVSLDNDRQGIRRNGIAVEAGHTR